MKILKTLSDLDEFMGQAKAIDKTVALVPTMGALHAGHLSLVEEGKKHADIVLAYIYLNPTQFAPHEDFDAYPRTLESDIEQLEVVGADAVWTPTKEDIYPNGKITKIEAGKIGEPLEGEFRPEYLHGVTTVLARMFDLVKPDVAVFGQKDFQQLQVIKAMTKEQGFDIKIVGGQTVRDENGLALSSRNAYLSDDEYKIAIQLNKILKRVASDELTEEQATKTLLDVGFQKVDYCTRRAANDLLPDPENPDRALVAAWLGKARLIDNMPITK